MDDARPEHSDPKTRIGPIADEVRAMNSLILSRIHQLREEPELVDQLKGRCSDLMSDLDAIRTANASPAGGTDVQA